MTLLCFPVSPLWAVQLFLYLHRKGIRGSFWKLDSARPTLLDAASESVHAQTWNAAQSCRDRHVAAALTISLDGDFHSLRSDRAELAVD